MSDSSEQTTERSREFSTESFTHDPVWCDECGLPVALSADWDDQQPLRYECDCTAVSPAEYLPDSWRNTTR